MMYDDRELSSPSEFSGDDGVAMAMAYLDDPSDVPCPHCGPETIEVVCYLDSTSVRTGSAITTAPEGRYMVVLFCHGCSRAGAVDLSDAPF